MSLENCKEEKPCGCPVKDLDAKCITVLDAEFSCSNIETPNQLNKVLEQLDRFICEKEEFATNYKLLNVGNGAKVYKGKDNLDNSLIRSIISSDSSIEIIQKSNEIDLKSKTILDIENEGDGIELYRQNDEGTKGYVKTLKSSDGSVTIKSIDEGHIDLKVDNILGSYGDQNLLYVNNAYTGDDEKGSLSQPFKTIDKALESYLGNGTRNNPEKIHGTIVIQRGDSKYTFRSNFNYRNLSVVIEENAEVEHNPNVAGGEYLMDLNVLNQNTSFNYIVLKRGALLTLRKRGFRNDGSTQGGSVKRIYITAELGSFIDFTPSAQPANALFESNYDTNVNYTTDQGHAIEAYRINCRALDAGLFKVGGTSSIQLINCSVRLQNTNKSYRIIPLMQRGGQVEMFDVNLTYENTNNSEYTSAFFLESLNGSQPKLKAKKLDIVLKGKVKYLISNGSLGNPNQCEVDFTHSSIDDIGRGLNKVIHSSNPTVKWSNVFFNLNTVRTGNQLLQVTENSDLTLGNTGSSLNWIRNQTVESLPKYPSRAIAAQNLLPGTKFINTHGPDSIDANSFTQDTVIV